LIRYTATSASPDRATTGIASNAIPERDMNVADVADVAAFNEPSIPKHYIFDATILVASRLKIASDSTVKRPRWQGAGNLTGEIYHEILGYRMD
jgi:hypothetical protein